MGSTSQNVIIAACSSLCVTFPPPVSSAARARALTEHHLVRDNVFVFAGAWGGANVNGGTGNMVRDNFAYLDGIPCGYDPSNQQWECMQVYALFGLLDGYTHDATLNRSGHEWLQFNRGYCPNCKRENLFGLIDLPNSVVNGNDPNLTLTPLQLLGLGFMAGGCPAKRHYWSGSCSGTTAATSEGAVAFMADDRGRQHGWASASCKDGSYTLGSFGCGGAGR